MMHGTMSLKFDGGIVGGEGWQEKVHNGEEWKKLLRTAMNRRILHMPMEWMNEYGESGRGDCFVNMILMGGWMDGVFRGLLLFRSMFIWICV